MYFYTHSAISCVTDILGCEYGKGCPPSVLDTAGILVPVFAPLSPMISALG